MPIDPRTRQLLWGRAGATCAFAGCRCSLVAEASEEHREVIVGEIAHIVAHSPVGPRGDLAPPGGALDGYENLILLCHRHHEIVDQQPQTYPVERLLQFKLDHEEWVRTQLSVELRDEGLTRSQTKVVETIYATMLRVTSLPHNIFSGECTVPEADVRASIKWPTDSRVFAPYIVRGGRLYAFNDLTAFESPFAAVVDPISARKESVNTWLADKDLTRWYVELLNRTVNKITGRLGLKLDKEHHRYYFEPDERGQDKSESYQTVGGVTSTRKVAWNPHFRHNDAAKRHWEHLAVGLRFHRLGRVAFGLSVRPERRFTSDGFESLEGKTTGKKSTKRKSRMYNFDLLQEVQFWRDFLSRGQPRISCLFGKQSLVIDNELLHTKIEWPLVLNDQAGRMAVTYEEDLVTLAELSEATEFDEFDDEVAELDDEAVADNED